MRFAVKRLLRAVVLSVFWTAGVFAPALAFPLQNGSVRFAVIGDCGTGDFYQAGVAQQLIRSRLWFPFTFAIMLGDNIYGAERPQDFARKFERPYKVLLDAGVEFNAALGNHDDQNQRFYKPYHLDGKRYRTFKKGNVRFFVLDSNYMDPEQVAWLRTELQRSGSDWKIAYFHHPLYTTARRGPEVELRRVLEPIFVEYGVDVVFSGHEHVYERLNPQKGISYFTSGAAAKLRRGDTRKTPLTAKTFDTDRSFMLVEVAGNELHYECISRRGSTVDRGVIIKRK
jgi:hypothetical protein